MSRKRDRQEVRGGSASTSIAAIRHILRDRNFRFLWIGQGISLLGDQLYIVALPWLVLQLTGSAFATGSVLALVAVPRAVFMLLGGALTDRLSPRVVMLASNLARLALVATLSVLTLTGVVQLWMLYIFALLFGFADAFFFPAQGAIVPRLVGAEHLQIGNAVIQGTAQLAMFVGPTLAGLMIALLGRRTASGSVPDSFGIGAALGLDALTFIASVVALSLMRMGRQETPDVAPKKTSVVRSILEGLTAIWEDAALRYYFILIAAATFLLLGPFAVGIPVLAHSRYTEGAMALGTILSSFGAGSLIGIVIAAVTPRPSGRAFPAVMLIMCAFLGIGLVLLGLSLALAPAALAALVLGFAQGYVVIQWITWMQIRTPAHMLGRTMSVLMFSVVGLAPLSNAAAGALIQLHPTVVMVSAGALIVLVVSVGALSPSVWQIGQDPATQETVEPQESQAPEETHPGDTPSLCEERT